MYSMNSLKLGQWKKTFWSWCWFYLFLKISLSIGREEGEVIFSVRKNMGMYLICETLFQEQENPNKRESKQEINQMHQVSKTN